MCPAKYSEKFAGKYRRWCPQSCARLHEYVCLHLNNDLYPDLNLNLYLYLFLNSFQQLFREFLAASFDSLFVLKYRQL